MLNKVKRALRISHTYLDDDIDETISAARINMVRAGVSPDKASGEDALVTMYIKAYCMAIYCNDQKMAEGYQRAAEGILDEMRKSLDYMEANTDV